jgi:hypothetical protein
MTVKRTKNLIAIAAIACLFVVGNQAFATENAIDVVPAATLLLPYFEVDLTNPNGRTTLFSVNNASAAPQLAHIVLWTDQSRPTLDFTIYLTGYDVFTANLGQLFRTGGIPPVQGPFAVNPANEIPGVDDNAGAFSIDTGDAVDAGENCPFPLPANIGPGLLAFIQSVHQGGPVPGGFGTISGLCGGTVSTGLARGYLTVDVVNNCDPLIHNNPGYFQGFAKTGFDANTIWGDFFLINPAQAFAQGEPLVHIETYADSVAGEGPVYTFYGRYVSPPYDGDDNREPLATTWGTRYLLGGVFTGGTDIICWRDAGTLASSAFFSCATRNTGDGQPMSQNQVVIFDEEENPVTIVGSPFSPSQSFNVCPWETQRVIVGQGLPVPFNFGWVYLNLNTNITGDFFGFHQAWVGSLMQASGLFSVGLQGVAFDHASNPTDNCIGLNGSVVTCN